MATRAVERIVGVSPKAGRRRKPVASDPATAPPAHVVGAIPAGCARRRFDRICRVEPRTIIPIRKGKAAGPSEVRTPRAEPAQKPESGARAWRSAFTRRG
jgi:hypothetical protein